MTLENINNFIANNPDDYEGYFNRGTFFLGEEKYEQAIEDLNKAISILPDVNIIYNRAVCYRKLKNYEMANNDLMDIIEQAPDHFIAFFTIGMNYFEQSMLNECLGYFRKTLELNPDFANVYMLIGIVYAHLDKNEEAIESLNMAKKLDKDLEKDCDTIINEINKHS